MDSKKQGTGKANIDKEYLKKLAEKIKAEKAKKEAEAKTAHPTEETSSQNQPRAPRPPLPPLPSFIDDDDNEGMESEKTAIIDLASLSGHAATARLIIIDGKDEGKSMELTRDEILAGRSLDNDFVVSDISVSRKHFRVVKDGKGYRVEDMESGNGIKLNGKKETSAILMDGDIITAGARNIRFEILDDNLKKEFTRKKDTARHASSPTGAAPRSSSLTWFLLILLIGFGVAGYFIIQSQQKQIKQVVQQQQAAPAATVGLEDLEKVDVLIYEEKNLDQADRMIATLLAKSPGSKFLQTRETLVKKEQPNAKKFHQAKALFEEKKQAEGEALLRQIPDDSLFYEDVVSLVGKGKVEEWAVMDVEELVKENKNDLALQKIAALLLEYPDNSKAKEIRGKLVSQVGAEKAQDIQKKVEEKKIEVKKEVEARKQKIAAKKPAVSRAASAPKKVESPAESAKVLFAEADIENAINDYLAKDFSAAIAKLDKIASGSDDKKLSSRAKSLSGEIKKFQKLYYPEDVRAKNVRILAKLDRSISKGQMKDELIDFYKSWKEAQAPAPSPAKEKVKEKAKPEPEKEKEAASSGGDEEQAKALYMEGLSLKDTNPAKAKDKFKEVLKTVPKDSKYYKKAQKQIKKL